MIEHYAFGRVTIDGAEYPFDVICHHGKVRPWRREKGHKVSRKDLVSLVEEGPAAIVFGTGAYGKMRLTGKARVYLEEQGIEALSYPTEEAVKVFNDLERQGKDVAIAMHLTC